MSGLPEERLELLRALFVLWEEERIVYLDDDLVVVDKPEGISTHAPDDDHKDDVVTRLGAHLAGPKAKEPAYLGIHQRLDRDTSGVLLFARRKSANASLAAQFEGRKVKKTYVAVTDGRLALPRDGILRHMISEGRDGQRVAQPVDRAGTKPSGPRGRPRPDPRGRGRPRSPQGKEAITAVKVLDTRGTRRLLELSPATGRTHQLRAQLAAAGAPIVGDVVYGGAPAARLMLHARDLEITHPSLGSPLVVSAPLPSAIAGALEERVGLPDAPETIEALMRSAASRRYGIAAREDTDAFRIVNGAGDALPGVAVDVYGDRLVVHLGEELDGAEREKVLDRALALGAKSVYVKVRPKQASRLSNEERGELAPRLAVRGEQGPEALLLRERDVPFEVRLGDGLSTGLFLDQRENRARMTGWAKRARVLNLFAYTGSFSVAAVLAGAASSVTVDVSPGVVAWAARNLARVGADPQVHLAIEADCFTYLEQAKRRGETFDLVILDPPSFATTKSSRFSADGDYRGLAAQAMRVIAPGGRLLACTNHRGIVMAKLRRFLHEAAREAGVEIAQMKDLPPPADFPPEPGKEPHLKSVLVTLVGTQNDASS